MGTEYKIIEKDSSLLVIDEMSCRFDITMYDCGGQEPGDITIQDIEPKEIIIAAIKMLEAASYFMTHEEFIKEFNKPFTRYLSGIVNRRE